MNKDVDPLVYIIKDMIHKKNKNYLQITAGATGSGKSFSAIKQAQTLDDDFSIKKIVFTDKEFMDLLCGNQLDKGDFIIWDEAGVDLDSRSWYEISRKTINYVMQTFRRDNLGVIFTCPAINFIDKNIRKLFHGYYEPITIDYINKLCIGKYLKISYNPRYDRIYYKTPMVVINGKTVYITPYNISKPSETIIKQYEHKKAKFANKLKIDALETINFYNNIKSIKMSEKKDVESIIREIKESPKKFKNRFGRFDRSLIQYKFKLGEPQAKIVKAVLSKEEKYTKK